MSSKRLLSFVVMCLLAGAALAQNVPDATTTTEDIILGTTSPDLLLRRGDVRDDLQLSADQSVKILTLQDSLAQQSDSLAQQTPGADKATADDQAAPETTYEALRKYAFEQFNQILTPEQMKRLRQISLQLTGYSALSWADVQKQMDLPKDLQDKIADLAAEEHRANASVLSKYETGDLLAEQIPEKIKKNHQILNDEIAKILPESVKDKFRALCGRTFKASNTP